MGAADTTKQVTFAIENRTGIGKFLLTDDSVYAYLIVGEVAWQFTGSGSSYTMSETGSTYSITLAPESTTTVAVDAALSVDSAQLWFSTSDTIVSSDGTVTKPTAGTAEYYYDFVEFTCKPSASGTSGLVNIDTTQVDQFGFPITLQISPPDPAFGSSSGISPGISRKQIFEAFEPYLSANNLTGFGYKACISGSPNAGDPPFSLVSPTHVCANSSSFAAWTGTLSPGTQNEQDQTWLATFTSESGIPSQKWNSCYAVGFPNIPIKTTIKGISNGSKAMTLTSPPSASDPFQASESPIAITVLTVPLAPVATYFDDALYSLFYGDLGSGIEVEYVGNTYKGSQTNVIATGSDNLQHSYRVLQFKNINTYNVFCPFFATNMTFSNLDLSKLAPLPPPPLFLTAQSFEPPSEMVFACDGVFASSTAEPSANSTTLASIENILVSAVVRGCVKHLPDPMKSDFYPSGGTWSAYAGFWHNAKIGSQSIYINGRGYAFAYDDQGHFSSDLTSTWNATTGPSEIKVTLQPWLSST